MGQSDNAALVKEDPRVEVDMPSGPSGMSSKLWRCIAIAALGVVLCLSGAVVGLAVAYVRKGTSASAPATIEPEASVPWATTHDKNPNPLNPSFTKPASVSADGSKVTQSVSVPNSRGGLTSLMYHATLTDDALNATAIDQDEKVVGARCEAGALLHIRYSSPAVAASEARSLVNGSLITGSAAWGCSKAHLEPNGSSQPTTIMYSVVSFIGVSGDIVTVSVAPASMMDFFSSLHVKYTDTVGPSTSSRRRLSLWSDLGGALYAIGGAALHAITHPISTLKTVATDAGKIASGDFSVPDSTDTLTAWSWPSAGDPTTSGDVDFSQSQVDFKVGISFGLDIEGWNLQNAELLVQGEATLSAGAKVGASATTSDIMTIPVLKSKQLGAAKFTIGPVPFNAAMDLGIDVNVNVKLAASDSFSAGATASASAEFGVTFASGAWQRVSNHDWKYSFPDPDISASESATASISLVPTLRLEFDWIGGPRASLIPYVAAQAEISSSGTCAAVVGYGLNVGVGADIDIKNPFTGSSIPGLKKSWPTTLIYQSGTKPMKKCDPCSSCVDPPDYYDMYVAPPAPPYSNYNSYADATDYYDTYVAPPPPLL